MQFYIYRILGEMGETLYIGKGTGRRLSQQKRRFAADGEVMEWLKSEKAAYRRERELIAEYNPPLNKSTGGNGSNFGHASYCNPPLYSGVAKIIRRLNGLEPKVRRSLVQMLREISASIGDAKFAAGLKHYGIQWTVV